MKRNATAIARVTGLGSMLVTLVVASFASYLYESAPTSPLVSVAAGLAGISFFLWAACGLLLWYKLWAWLFRSWPTRGAAGNIAWSLLVMSGSIVLPLFVPRLLADSEAPGSQGEVDSDCASW